MAIVPNPLRIFRLIDGVKNGGTEAFNSLQLHNIQQCNISKGFNCAYHSSWAAIGHFWQPISCLKVGSLNMIELCTECKKATGILCKKILPFHIFCDNRCKSPDLRKYASLPLVLSAPPGIRLCFSLLHCERVYL
jgi:endogenous inhibitor of DNA gyrase (YacG/DUF329 family)